jgi:hypothetical protein
VQPQPIPENIAQQAALERLSQPKALFEAKAAYGGNPILANAEQIKTLPTMTEAQTEERAPSQQVPALKASMLKDATFTQTSEGRRMLAQALVQQQAQQQAEAVRKREAERAIVKFGPEDTAGRIVNGVFKPIVQGVKQPKWEKSSQYDVNGREITGWVNTNAPDIPGSFVRGATKPEMTAAQLLDAQLKLHATNVEAAKLSDVGKEAPVFTPLPKGVPLGAKKVGTDKATGKDVYKLNNDLFVGE